MVISSLVHDFADQHQLPESFIASAKADFLPLADSIFQQAKKSKLPLFVGINGCQGSGKSTLTDFLLYAFNHQYQLPSKGVSIDDFYLTKAARKALAAEVHPLLLTRGVPGTHEIPLMESTLSGLLAGKEGVSIPRFNKAIDDRYPEKDWEEVSELPKVVLFEGWCVGCQPQDEEALKTPVNELEQEEDKDGVWRHFVNNALQVDYQTIFSRFDRFIMLKAPSFKAVENWREQQEARLRESVIKNNLDGSSVMSPSQIRRFIAHYQRITEHALDTLAPKANDLFELNENRVIQNSSLGQGLLL